MVEGAEEKGWSGKQKDSNREGEWGPKRRIWANRVLSKTKTRDKIEREKIATNVNNAMGFRDKFNKFDRVCVYVRWS